MLGLLQERMGLNLSAEDSFKKALVCSNDYKDHDKVYINYARILVKLKKFDKAVDTLKCIKAASFNSVCTLALALFKGKIWFFMWWFIFIILK